MAIRPSSASGGPREPQGTRKMSIPAQAGTQRDTTRASCTLLCRIPITHPPLDRPLLCPHNLAQGRNNRHLLGAGRCGGRKGGGIEVFRHGGDLLALWGDCRRAFCLSTPEERIYRPSVNPRHPVGAYGHTPWRPTILRFPVGARRAVPAQDPVPSPRSCPVRENNEPTRAALIPVLATHPPQAKARPSRWGGEMGVELSSRYPLRKKRIIHRTFDMHFSPECGTVNLTLRPRRRAAAHMAGNLRDGSASSRPKSREISLNERIL